MGISIDNTGQHTTIQSGTSASISNFIISSGNNRMAICYVYVANDTNVPSSVTFGSQNFTLLTTFDVTSGNFAPHSKLLVYYLVAPTVSSTTAISITFSAMAGNWAATAVSYFGVSQSGAGSFGTPQTAYSATSPISVSITTGATNSFIVTVLAENASGISTYSGTSPQSVRSNSNYNNGGGYVLLIGDGSYPSIGTYTDQYTWTGGAGTTSTAIIGFEMLAALIQQSVSDTLSTVESVTKIIAKSISDSISISADNANKSINKTIFDTLGINDSIKAIPSTYRLSDNILITDTVSISKTIIKSVVDNLVVGDTISKSLGRQINDSPSLSDVLSKNIDKILADNLSLVDIISKNITKLIVENPSFLDSTGQSRTLVRQVIDALSILESTVISKQITEQIIDNLSSGDSISKNIGKLLQDNPILAEQLSKAIAKIITDNISIPDSVTKNIGSLLLNQTRRINLNNTTQQTIAEGKPRNVTI